jgi:hypothetical protein
LIIDMHDPESIAAWVLVYPKRHGPQMLWFAQFAQFCDAIEAARVIVRARL